MLRRVLLNFVLPAAMALLSGAAAAQSVEVELIHYGVGDVIRGGGPVAAQFQFRSGLDRVTEIEAVWEVPNADLDIVEHARRFVLNPGQGQKRWLYAVLPPLQEGSLAGTIFDLRLYEIAGGERVRDLGTVKIAPSTASNPPRVIGLADDAFLVVGPRTSGLDIYSQSAQNGAIPSMNTLTVCANVRDVESFPDRWEGLAMFDSIVWSDGSVAPARLSEESARAMELWTERGGNFVVALPSAGDPWSVGVDGRHRFSALLPSVAPERIEDVPVRELLPMLSLSESLRDRSATMRLAVFDAAKLDRGWRPFIATPAPKGPDGNPAAKLGPYEGKLVGIRRELGFGHMTLLGIDVEEISARSLQVPAIPQGDVFWNRILGRRADTPSGQEYTQLGDASRLIQGSGYTKDIGDGKSIAEKIGLSGQAAFGVLAATLVFGLYWLVAGPLGFAALRALKRERWAWVAYVGIAAVFTVAIWLIGRSVSGRDALASHFTVLDMVERAPGEGDITQVQRRRATSWLSVYAPDYGETEVALDPAGDPSLRNVLASWRPSSSTPEGFPSRERYVLPLDAPNRATVPSRATTVDFKADWMGALREGWGQMPTVSEPISVSVSAAQGAQTISITGSLTHRLPGALRDVQILHVWPKQNPLQSLAPSDEGTVGVRRFVGQLPNRGVLVSAPDWPAGQPLDLSKSLPKDARLSDRMGLEQTLERRYYSDLEQQLRTGFGIVGDSLGFNRTIEMLGFYGMLHPPRYLRASDSRGALRIPRLGGRELDLSKWMTQPCLMVMGRLEDVPLPFELTLDGESLAGSGDVLVRWIIPLPESAAWVVPDKFPRSGAGSSGE